MKDSQLESINLGAHISKMRLILQSPPLHMLIGFSVFSSTRSEPGTVVEFKTKARLELENKGFRIWAGIGDQWNDLRGEAIGKRVFKLPNSLYYT